MISLLFFTIIAITITSGAIVVIIANSSSTDRFQQGVLATVSAEAGIENALLQLLRNPNYSGETLTVGSDLVQISVTGTTSKTITSITNAGNSSHKIEVQAQYQNNILSISSWKEVY